MNNDEKDQVYKAYNKIADWYTQHRSQELFEQPYFEIIKHVIEDKECGGATVWVMQYKGY